MTIRIVSTEQGVDAVVTGPWSSADEDEFHDSEASGLVLNYALGYQERSLDFLTGLSIKRLTVLARTTRDHGPIYELSPQLEELRLTTDPGLPLDLARLPHLKVLSADWRQVSASLWAATRVEDAYFGSYSEETLEPLREMNELVRLSMKDRPGLRSLKGVSDLPSLSSFTVGGARALEDVSDLMSTEAPQLTYLKLASCKNVRDLKGLAHQLSLSSFTFGDCGDLPSLSPLRGLERLERLFLHGSTRILDGDLQPLLDLPRLRELWMMNRREYEPSVKVIKSEIERRTANS